MEKSEFAGSNRLIWSTRRPHLLSLEVKACGEDLRDNLGELILLANSHQGSVLPRFPNVSLRRDVHLVHAVTMSPNHSLK